MSVEAAEDALRAAQLSGDVAALERLLDERLLFAGLNGELFTKSDDLAAHRSGQLKIERLDVLERRIEAHGDFAVAAVKVKAAARVGGQRHENTLRYTRFWKRVDGQWRIIGGHMSEVAK